MVVGLKVNENKAIYTGNYFGQLNYFVLTTSKVDDGTGVIDCHYMHRDRPAGPPTKQISKYQRPETQTLPEPPKPIADIGQTVRVIGIVRPWYETRIISVNHLR